MTIYTKKKGKYVALTKDQIHRMQRRDHTLDLQRQAVLMANSMIAVMAWFENLKCQHGVVAPQNMAITSAPSMKYMYNRVVGVKNAVAVLQKGEKVGKA